MNTIAAKPVTPSTGNAEPARPAAKGLAVLLADDAIEVQSTVRRWLEEAGHSVQCAASGNEATRLVQQQRFDLVITEIIMPNGDGLELILELKKRQPAARIIALSGGGRYLRASDCLHVAKGLGAHEVFAKPARRAELLAAVAKIAAS